MFLDAIEEKRQFEQKAREHEEFQDKTLKIYTDIKQQIGKEMKERAKREREMRAWRNDIQGINSYVNC